MTETLLSPSNVLLFGRKVEDLIVEPIVDPVERAKAKFAVDIAYNANVSTSSALANIDQGVRLRKGMSVLLAGQSTASENGLYKLDKDLKLVKLPTQFSAGLPPDGVFVRNGTYAKSVYTVATATPTFSAATYLPLDRRHGPFRKMRGGLPSDTEQQLDDDFDPILARIYGFTFEGTYYDLPRPALFLVHGEGFDFTEFKVTKRSTARAPAEPSTSGLGASDFDFADDIKVWSYDKADYTIRMDVETGQFEDVLLPMIGGGGGPGASGARVSGARVSGARVSGARLSGGRADAGD